MNTLKLTGLKKSYGNTRALDNLNFSFQPGIYGVLGKNGAGKSTLIKVLTTIIDDYVGDVSYNGKPINNSDYRNIIGYMPQHQTLIPYMSIERFLLYMASLKGLKKDEAISTINKLLKELNLIDRKNSKIESLSGGMKQRVLIAQAMLNDPMIIFFDEPTTGLDPIERSNFRNYLYSVSENKIILIATHIISDLEYICDEILILSEGKIVLSGSQEEILSKTLVNEERIDGRYIEEMSNKYKVINLSRTLSGVNIRYLSNIKSDKTVEANLDDVFIKWVK